MDLQEGVTTAKEAAKTAEKFPWGTSIVIALLTAFSVWFIMNAQVRDMQEQRNNCIEENSEINKELRNQLFEKQQTIETQQAVIEIADSSIRQVTRSKANDLLQKRKR